MDFSPSPSPRRRIACYREESLKRKKRRREHVHEEGESSRWNSDETGSDTAFLPTLKLFLYAATREPVSRRETLVRK